jgi:hypothetical protein
LRTDQRRKAWVSRRVLYASAYQASMSAWVQLPRPRPRLASQARKVTAWPTSARACWVLLAGDRPSFGEPAQPSLNVPGREPLDHLLMFVALPILNTRTAVTVLAAAPTPSAAAALSEHQLRQLVAGIRRSVPRSEPHADA